MAGRPEQDETMPDDVMKAQPPPGMKDDPKAIKRAAGQHAPQRHLRQRRNYPVVEHEAAPAEREIKPDREAVEPAGPAELQHDAEDGDAPDAGQQRQREYASPQFQNEGRVGGGNQEIDRRMIEAAQHPFGARYRPEV